MFDFLSEQAQASLSKHFDVENVAISWERPEDSSHGDIASSIALQLSKKLGKKPQDIAQVLCENLSSLENVQRCEVAGPGFVNVWLSPAFLIESLGATREACTAKVTRKDEAPVIVEYSQPNVAKPLGAHHLLTTVIGQAIANLYRHAGHDVITWNYMGDWGTQFGKLSIAYERWGGDRPAAEYSVDELLDLYVRFHEEAEKDPSLEDKAREAFQKLERGDEQLRAFWNDVLSVTKAALGSVYERLQVQFDSDLSESFYEDKMQPILDEGVEKGVFIEGEGGALIATFDDENMPPYMVRKSDGATLYSTRDLAQMRYRIDTHHPESILIVTDVAQKLHFEQLVETCNQLEWELPSFENVLVGRMRFADKSMSTRKGNIIKLEHVLEEAVTRAEKAIADRGDQVQTDDPSALAETMGVGSVSYGILSQNRKMDIVFDWDKCLSFDGNSAPYLQYTYARSKSVLRKAEVTENDVQFPEMTVDLVERERSLINTLLQFAQVLEEARSAHMPHLLANYLFELCQEFNAFYNAEPILKADEPQKSLRLALTGLTSTVLRVGADLLTIRVPERM